MTDSDTTLYKFVTADVGMRVLKSCELKVSALTELNDVFDCAPLIEPPSDEPGHTTETWTDHVLTHNACNYGTVCFSRTYRSPLLWAHYSDSAAGLALGFHSGSLAWGKNPLAMTYQPDRPKFKWASEKEIDATFVNKMLCLSFGVKAQEWRYEEETRFILALNTCLRHSGMYFARFPQEALREVILGFRGDIDGAVRDALSRHFPHGVDVKIARPHADRYEMELRNK